MDELLSKVFFAAVTAIVATLGIGITALLVKGFLEALKGKSK